MKSLTSLAHAALQDVLAECPGAVLEHVAEPCYQDHALDLRSWTELGYEVVFRNDDVIFIQHKEYLSRRKEIIHRGRLPHEAWAVQTQKEFAELDTAFTFSAHFEEIEDERIETAELMAKMFLYCGPDASDEKPRYYQIIWRKDQIFRDVFEG